MDLKEVACDICGGTDLDTVVSCTISSQDAKLSPPSMNIVRCRSCGLTFVNPRPVFSQEELDLLYCEDYYQDTYSKYLNKDKCLDVESNEEYSLRLSLIDEVCKDEAGQRRRLLDIGCATGAFLEAAGKSGWDVVGLEASQYAVDSAIKRYGIEVHKSSLEDARFESGSFDAVTCGDILEHMPSPKAFLKEVARVLKKDGVLYIAVPNFNSLHYKIMTLIAGFNHKNYFVLPYHLYHFTECTLKRLLASSGFEVVRLIPSQSRYELPGLKGSIVRLIYSVGKLLRLPDRLLVLARKA